MNALCWKWYHYICKCMGHCWKWYHYTCKGHISQNPINSKLQLIQPRVKRRGGNSKAVLHTVSSYWCFNCVTYIYTVDFTCVIFIFMTNNDWTKYQCLYIVQFRIKKWLTVLKQWTILLYILVHFTSLFEYNICNYAQTNYLHMHMIHKI